ncbi:hypothetical protein YA0002_14560 [Pseudomonas cichorii]|uniref:hypothetical protein n=1 Tax=Pseudomonas cichorii TaxID=36746 RepID=UPI0018E5C7EB|nr:hypothetical protein [Pseudomonas cichorii]MBI6853994.1 hypothetical protein [Pseudomonas cichorii]
MAAWKEEALTVYLSAGNELIDAVERFGRGQVQAPEVHRKVLVEDADLRALGI